MKTKTKNKQQNNPKRISQLVKLFQSPRKSPLLWLLHPGIGDEATCEQINRWYRHLLLAEPSEKNRHALAAEISESLSLDFSPSGDPGRTALLALAVAQVLPALDESRDAVPDSKLVAMRDTLLGLVESAPKLPQESGFSAWHAQALRVELPLTLSLLTAPENKLDLNQAATAMFSESVDELLDYDGWPQAANLPIFGPLMASWSRSLALIRKMKLEIHPDSESQYEWAVRQLLRLLRPDRTLVFGGFESPSVTDECLALMLKLSDDVGNRRLAKRCLSKVAEPKTTGKSSPGQDKSAEASSISEWGLSGLLQSRWGKGSPKVGFDFSNQSFGIEIGAGETLVSGVAMPVIKLNGVSLQPLDDFSIVCNEHDQEVDYVEFQMEMSAGVTLTRQLILSRHEDFLMIADCVFPLQPGKIDYECDWPLAPGITVLPETETREVYLQNRKIQSLVLPLSLPEWKVGPSSGRLEEHPRGLRLIDRAAGRGIYVPIVFDLNPKRSGLKRTWRKLTVGEELQPVPPDSAAAFRFQLNNQQWFFYRVVSEKGNRTFLGENFNGEFVFGRFGKAGKVSELLRIE